MAKDLVDKATGEIVFKHVYPRLRAAYDDHMPMSDASGLFCADESLADQSAAEEADINTIVRRFGITGHMPENVRMPTYGDFTGLGSFQEALNAVVQAKESFLAMPADVRYRFGNDPGQFVAFCSDEKNKAEASRLGLLSADAFEAYQASLRDAEAARVQAEIERRQAADLKAQGAGKEQA